ncbi:MAG: GntR family transcriptional regulator [Leptolyngbyaceae cyanobacterium SL_7_1]|nr:GntR family transcriptional regulator [Leptolyngbyaceae cyanobacterium SL_7_1]
MSRFTQSLQRNQPLKDQAYQALRAAILSGELVPGQRLVEAQLAKQLQVSRTPIREALILLQRESLLTIDSENSLRVATFSIEDAIQLYACRLALEQVSIAGACQNATATELRQLQRVVNQADKLADSKPSPLLNFQLLDIDYQFHRLLAEMSKNFWLCTMLDQVFDKMMLLRIQTIQQNQKVLDIRSEHRLIYEAVTQQDPNAAIDMLSNHLNAARDRVIEELKIYQSNRIAP